MNEPTPGPWHLADDGDIWADRPDGPFVIARCEDLDADAYLIAAAPNLLAACEAFLACPPRDRHDLHLEEIIALAVARAKGGDR